MFRYLTFNKMYEFFYSAFGVSEHVFNWVILPIIIFLARITDVTISTLRVMLVMAGKRNIAPFLGFFEALIWLLAIGQIIQNISNVASYIAYAAGFATGTYMGMLIESKLAIGKVLVRIITRTDASELIAHLSGSERFGYTNIRAESKRGGVNVIFSVVRRENLPEMLAIIKKFSPNASYTIENVRYVSDLEGHYLAIEDRSFLNRFSMLRRK